MACFLGLLTFISYAYFSGYLEPNKAHEPIEAIKDKAINIEEVTRTIENDPQGYFTNQEDFEQSGILEKLDSIYEERLILITGEAVEMDSSLILGQLVVDTTIENREIIILKLNENRNEKDK